MGAYFHRIAVQFDDLIQACLKRGIPGITISTRAYLATKVNHKWGCILCKILAMIQTDHCHKAFLHDRQRAQDALDYLKGYD